MGTYKYALYKDTYGNTAKIHETELKPYNDAISKEKAFVLSLYDGDGFLYYRSCFDVLQDAKNHLKSFSCGSFRLCGGGFDCTI